MCPGFVVRSGDGSRRKRAEGIENIKENFLINSQCCNGVPWRMSGCSQRSRMFIDLRDNVKLNLELRRQCQDCGACRD